MTRSGNSRSRPGTAGAEPGTELLRIEDLKPDPSNARAHDETDLEAVKASLRDFGQQKPIVVGPDNTIIAGHGTVAAAEALGWTEIEAKRSRLEGPRATAYAIADNRTAELSAWNRDQLRENLEGLGDLASGAPYLDFSDEELGLEDIPIQPDSDPDEVPPPRALYVETGHLYALGQHRLLCGDARDPEQLGRLLEAFGKKTRIDAVVTDPPYGVSYVGRTGERLEIQGDDLATFGATARRALTAAADRCRPGAAWYVCAPSGPQFWEFAETLRELRIWRQTLVWIKSSLVLSHSDYHYQHETIFHGWSPREDDRGEYAYDQEAILYGWSPGPHHPPPDRKQTSVWEIPRPAASREHPTMKPVELVSRALVNSTRRDELVYDPFVGSGTTLVASHLHNRRCAALEVDPRYAQATIERWQKVTGEVAEKI